MNPFDHSLPADADSALADLGLARMPAGTATASKFIAGGTNLIDLMKEGLMRPAALVDINRLPLATVTDAAGGALRLGALMRNADTAERHTAAT